jgi:hypothetical protein
LVASNRDLPGPPSEVLVGKIGGLYQKIGVTSDEDVRAGLSGAGDISLLIVGIP